jgi:hypothetical protein
VRAIVGHEPRRHGLEGPGKEQIEQQGLDEVVEVVTERDLARADLGRQPIQDAAAEPRAERTRRGIVVEQIFDCLADLGVDDAVLPAAGFARLRDEVVTVAVVPESTVTPMSENEIGAR